MVCASTLSFIHGKKNCAIQEPSNVIIIIIIIIAVFKVKVTAKVEYFNECSSGRYLLSG